MTKAWEIPHMGEENKHRKQREDVRFVQTEQKIIRREGRLVTEIFMVYCVIGLPASNGPQGQDPPCPPSLHQLGMRVQNFRTGLIGLECLYWSVPHYFVSQ